MSSGAGSIIIRQLIESPDTTEQEKQRLIAINTRFAPKNRCTLRDALFIQRLVWRLVR